MQVTDTGRARRSTAILGVACLALELALAPQLGIANGRANFMLVFAAVVAMGQGGRTGTVAGFVAGLLFDLSTTGPVGLMAFELTLASHVLGRGVRNRFAEERAATMTSFLVADLAVSAAYSLAMLMVGQSSSLVDCVFLRSLPTALLTLVAFLPFWWAMSRSGGGMSFGGGSGLFLAGGRRSKHLDTRGL